MRQLRAHAWVEAYFCGREQIPDSELPRDAPLMAGLAAARSDAGGERRRDVRQLGALRMANLADLGDYIQLLRGTPMW